MALPAYFFIRGYEIGASQAGKLQYLNGTVWTDLVGDWVANDTNIRIDSNVNVIPVDYGIFSAGGTYYFRLIDTQGHPISNVVSFTFPFDAGGDWNSDWSDDFNINT